MSESKSHKRAKYKAPGKPEVPISKNRRLDSASKHTATEVERSGSKTRLKKAALRLKDSGRRNKVLQVPQKDMPKAVKTMRDESVPGTVKNMSGTKKRYVPKKK